MTYSFDPASSWSYTEALRPFWGLGSLGDTTFSDHVDSLINKTRTLSEGRMLSDPYYRGVHNFDFMWWRPTALEREVVDTPIRARSLSPFRDSPLLRATRSVTPFVDPPGYSTPSMVRAATPPLRNTSISYNSTSPWNATGFYYSPRYPEAYRGTSSTYQPYSFSRRYYDYDPANPYRVEYFKFPRKDYGFGASPYKGYRKFTSMKKR